MISPFRRDVLLTGLLLAVPVLLLGLRGDFTLDDVTHRLPWCLAAGWAAVALVRWASTPPAPRTKEPAAGKPDQPAAPDPDEAPAPA